MDYLKDYKLVGTRPLLIDKLNNDSNPKSRIDGYGIATHRLRAVLKLLPHCGRNLKKLRPRAKIRYITTGYEPGYSALSLHLVLQNSTRTHWTFICLKHLYSTPSSLLYFIYKVLLPPLETLKWIPKVDCSFRSCQALTTAPGALQLRPCLLVKTLFSISTLGWTTLSVLK
jgi:hypothetical protein